MKNKNEQWYYALPGEKTVGPLSYEEIKTKIAEGTVLGDTAVWTENFGEKWQRAGSVSALKPAWMEVEKKRWRLISETGLNTVPVKIAVRAAWEQTKTVLFKPFSFMMWVSLLFCTWMAGNNMFQSVMDEQTLRTSMSDTSVKYGPYVAVLKALCNGAKQVFEENHLSVWAGGMLIYLFLAGYVCVKGRLILLNKTYAPYEPLGMGWRRSIGKTRSLVFFYVLAELFSNLAVASSIYYFFLRGGFISGETEITMQSFMDAVFGQECGQWILAGLLAYLLARLIRSFAFHFVEPLVFRFTIPAPTALKMAAKLHCKAPGRFLAYYLTVAVIRIIYLLIGGVTLTITGILLLPNAAALSAAAGLPLMLLTIMLRLILMPIDYFIRILGTRFVI